MNDRQVDVQHDNSFGEKMANPKQQSTKPSSPLRRRASTMMSKDDDTPDHGPVRTLTKVTTTNTTHTDVRALRNHSALTSSDYRQHPVTTWCPSPASASAAAAAAFTDEPLRLVSFVSESGYSALNRRGQRARSFNVGPEHSHSSPKQDNAHSAKGFAQPSSEVATPHPKTLLRHSHTNTRPAFHFSDGRQLITVDVRSFKIFFSIDFTLPPSPLINATQYRPFPHNPLYDTHELDPSAVSRLEYDDIHNPIKAGLIKLAQNAIGKQKKRTDRTPLFNDSPDGTKPITAMNTDIDKTERVYANNNNPTHPMLHHKATTPIVVEVLSSPKKQSMNNMNNQTNLNLTNHPKQTTHNVLPLSLSGGKIRTRMRTQRIEETHSDNSSNNINTPNNNTPNTLSSPFNLDSPKESLLSPSPLSHTHSTSSLSNNSMSLSMSMSMSASNNTNTNNSGGDKLTDNDNICFNNLPQMLFEGNSASQTSITSHTSTSQTSTSHTSQTDSNKALSHSHSNIHALCESPNTTLYDSVDVNTDELKSLSSSSSSFSVDSGIPDNIAELFFSMNAITEDTSTEPIENGKLRRRSNSNSVLINNSITSLSTSESNQTQGEEEKLFAIEPTLCRRAMSVRVPQTGRYLRTMPKQALLSFSSSGYVFSSTANGILSYLLDPTISIDHDFCETLIYTHQAYLKTDVLFKALSNLYKTPFRTTKPLMKYPQFSHYKEAVRLRILFFLLLFASLFSGETLSSFDYFDFISSLRKNEKKNHSKYFTFMFLKASNVNMTEVVTLTRSDFEKIVYTFHLPISDLLGQFQYFVYTSPFYLSKQKTEKQKNEKQKARAFLRLQAVFFVQYRMGIPLQFTEMLFDHLISIGWIEKIENSSDPPLYCFTEKLKLKSKNVFKPLKNVHVLLGMFDPFIVAQQLTLFNSRLVSSIKMSDIGTGDWKDVEKNPSISKCSEASAHFQLFILQEVLKVAKLSKRIKIVQHLVYIAYYCYLYRNYNTALDILTALNQPIVQRLSQTFKGLNSNVKKLLSDLNELFSFASNFKNYRKEIAKVKIPFIPFFAITFRDLTCIHEIIDKDENINFQKYSLLKGSVKILADSQKSQYDIQEHGDIYPYIDFENVKPDLDLEELVQLCK